MDEPQVTRIGPFQTRGGGGFLLPVGIITIACVISGLVFLVAVAAFSTSHTCSVEWGLGWSIGAAFAAGGAAFSAALSLKKTEQSLLAVGAGLVALFLGRYLVHLIYVPYCNNPFLRGF
jgi:hypothetical protein